MLQASWYPYWFPYCKRLWSLNHELSMTNLDGLHGSTLEAHVYSRLLPPTIREFKIPQRRRPRKRLLQSEFAFFIPLWRLFQLAYFVKCKRTLLEPNSKQPYPSSDRGRNFRRRLFMSSVKRDIRHFHVIVM